MVQCLSSCHQKSNSMGLERTRAHPGQASALSSWGPKITEQAKECFYTSGKVSPRIPEAFGLSQLFVVHKHKAGCQGKKKKKKGKKKATLRWKT